MMALSFINVRNIEIILYFSYIDQRSKEASYILRLCHLNAISSEGAPAVNFGFEITENTNYEYPIISQVEPKFPGDLAGLQPNDILLKINDRKTKGLEFDRVKKAIEKAKRDGRLEMLVVDAATYNYCKRTKKNLKEPDLKIKHIFPKSRSTARVLKVPLINGMHTSTLQTSSEHIEDSDDQLLRTENDSKNEQISPTVDCQVNFDVPETISSTEVKSKTTVLHKTLSAPTEFTHPEYDRHEEASRYSSRSSTSSGSHDHKSRRGSKKSSVSNAITNILHRIGPLKTNKR